MTVKHVQKIYPFLWWYVIY